MAAAGCRTVGGAAVGAGAGAAIGAGTGYGAGKGALIGTGLGAAAGTIYDITKHRSCAGAARSAVSRAAGALGIRLTNLVGEHPDV